MPRVFIICIFSSILFMSGCAQIKETTRGIIGISTNQIDQARVSAIAGIFPYDYKTCYEKTTKALKRMNTYTYTIDKRKKLIAIFVSESDTTPVGIFFTEVDAANTKIEVSSPSSYAKELISGKLFRALSVKEEPEAKAIDAQTLSDTQKGESSGEKTSQDQ